MMSYCVIEQELTNPRRKWWKEKQDKQKEARELNEKEMRQTQQLDVLTKSQTFKSWKEENGKCAEGTLASFVTQQDTWYIISIISCSTPDLRLTRSVLSVSTNLQMTTAYEI